MSVRFSKLKNDSVRMQVVYEIERKIFSGELACGERMPPERDIAIAMDVSRSLINLALRDLEVKGFIKIVPRKGTFVADYKTNSTPQMLLALIHYGVDFADIKIFENMLETRQVIECKCAKLAANNKLQDKTKLEKAFKDMKESTNFNEFANANFKFHHTICAASGNIIFSMIFKSFEETIIYYLEKFFTTKKRQQLSISMHYTLLCALMESDVKKAEDAMGAIIEEGSKGLIQMYEEK